MPTTHKAPAYRKAYSYVNKHGKIVHVAAKGVPPAQEQSKGRAKNHRKTYSKEQGAPGLSAPEKINRMAFTPEEKEALYAYQTGGFAAINALLRHGETHPRVQDRLETTDLTVADIRQQITDLRSAIVKHTLAASVRLYRGLRLPKAVLQQIQEGKKFTDAGFFSTSKSESEARSMWDRTEGLGTRVLFTVAAQKGQTALDLVQHVGMFAEEQEVLFSDKTSFYVTKISVGKEGRRKVVYVSLEAVSSSKSSSTSKSCRRSHAEGPRPSPVISGQISSSIGRGSSRGRSMAVISPGGRRSVKSDLVKARTVGAKNKGPRQGRYGVLTSTDPSFYPGKGGMRYLSAAEAGRAGDIVARYARRGVAVNFVPSVHGQDHAATKPSPEEQMADETVAAVDALRARIARKPVDTTKLAALPNIGVDPLQQPMIYLLSLGRGAAYEEMKGPAPLTAQESKALLAEFEPILKQTVDALSRRFRLPPADRAELRSDASLFLLESARTYDARSRGVPAEGNNFLALMLASMPKRLRGKVLENRRQPTGQTPYTESDSDDVLATAARAARIETPEQRLRRQQLAQSVRQSFFNVLSPVEYAVVISRLNILDQQTQGTVAGLKPWKQVREDVLLHATALADTPRDAEKLAGHLQKVRAANYRVIFDRAMEKLRSPTGLTGQARQNLAELADLHRLYLEGVRHESFGSDAFGRLQLGEALATLGPEQKAQKSLMSLPLEQRRRAILEAWPLLAKAFGSSQRCYELCKALLEQSTDALRHRLSAPVPVDVRPPDYQEAVVWALKRGIHRSLCVVPPYQNAWAGLLDECAIWQLNGR